MLRFPRLARQLHTQLPDIGFSAKEGVRGLFSPQGLDVAWFQYQKHLLTSLNETIKQDEGETLKRETTPFGVLTAASKRTDPVGQKAALLASQAHNNEFFFRSLSHSADPGAVPGKTNPKTTKLHGSVFSDRFEYQSPLKGLSDSIAESFDSAQAMHQLFCDRGDAIFGNGYIWLIYDSQGLSFVNTYGPQALDQAGQLGVAPLLAVSVCEHSFLTDYGVGGKRTYLENAFAAIDWLEVASRQPKLNTFLY